MMDFGGIDMSPPYISSYSINGPYSSSLASSASSSSTSVWSDASSQSSDDSSVTSASVLYGSQESECYSGQSYQAAQTIPDHNASIPVSWPKDITRSIAPEFRQHPRRTTGCSSSSSRQTSPPALIRQCDRKLNFVDSLVDSSAQIVEAIWPLSSIRCRIDAGSKGVLPLRVFIQETLRRSRTSYSTLQVALYYLILIKPHVPQTDFTMEQTEDSHSFRALQCGRRMFLSALILASKYLQDRNYSARAWSKISGLNTQEINQNEVAFLLAVNWRLHITNDVFQRWVSIVLEHTPPAPPSQGSAVSIEHEKQSAEWKSIVLKLNANLDNLNSVISSSFSTASVEETGAISSPVIQRTHSFESGPAQQISMSYHTPEILEPYPSTADSPDKVVPAYGLLPTPRLTPKNMGYRTPAAIPSSHVPRSAMALAQTQACQRQFTEAWATSSPHAYRAKRRSSLANSVSTVSSPESMVSDSSSRSSRSSSISSVSSTMCAPQFKLDVLARCRSAQQFGEAFAKTTISSVPESYNEIRGQTFSPETYVNPVAKHSWPSTESLDSGEYQSYATTVDVDAARTLQELQHSARSNAHLLSSSRGSKRSRPGSMDNVAVAQARVILQDEAHGWSSCLARPAFTSRTSYIPRTVDGRKRACCGTELCAGISEDSAPRVGNH